MYLVNTKFELNINNTQPADNHKDLQTYNLYKLQIQGHKKIHLIG